MINFLSVVPEVDFAYGNLQSSSVSTPCVGEKTTHVDAGRDTYTTL